MINKTPKLTDFLPNSFILYKPKDVVSGDFYWYSKVDDKIVVAAVDCTGHGVPGAFLTVLGNNLLNQIVTISKITDPGEILLRMHHSVANALNQKSSNNKDGMDIALCTIDTKTNKLYFAGANNPLVMILNDEMQIIKGNKYGIGGFSAMIYKKRIELSSDIVEMYNTHEFNIEPDTDVYIFSDGFQDQVGGNKSRKLGTRKFYELLKLNHKAEPGRQKKQLLKFYEDWKGENEQVDDIVIVGIKF